MVGARHDALTDGLLSAADARYFMVHEIFIRILKREHEEEFEQAEGEHGEAGVRAHRVHSLPVVEVRQVCLTHLHCFLLISLRALVRCYSLLKVRFDGHHQK